MHARVLRQVEAAARKAGASPCSERAVMELIDCAQGLAEVRRAYEAAAAQDFLAETFVALGRELERAEQGGRLPARRRAGPAQPAGRLRVVRAVVIGAGIAWAAARAALKAHPATAGVSAMALAGAMTLSGGTWHTAPDVTAYRPPPAPAAGIVSAVPLRPPPRPRPSRTAPSHAVTGTGSPAAWPSAPPPASQPARPPAARAVLAVPPSVELSAALAGTLVIAAPGGPVTWSASAPDPGVGLSEPGGKLEAGQREVIEIRVSRALAIAAGRAVIVVQAGHRKYLVDLSWPGQHAPSPY